jgi:hypothetical protein
MGNLLTAANELVRNGDAFIEKHGSMQFHQAAQELLDKTKLHEKFDFSNLVYDSLSEKFNQKQNYASSQFSDFSITLAAGKNCSLDLYFWYRSPTVIHNHHFTGAFQCMQGVNVDLEFEYKGEQSIGHYHELGKLELKHTRKLVKGDIAPIDLLDKFIHQNHHQADLTINACFRTPDIGEVNLSNYLYSGLRFEKNPDLVARTHRLWSFLFLGDFKFENLDLTVDDAMSFLIRYGDSTSASPRFTQLCSLLDHMLQSQLGIDIKDHLNAHHTQMTELENLYD